MTRIWKRGGKNLKNVRLVYPCLEKKLIQNSGEENSYNARPRRFRNRLDEVQGSPRKRVSCNLSNTKKVIKYLSLRCKRSLFCNYYENYLNTCFTMTDWKRFGRKRLLPNRRIILRKITICFIQYKRFSGLD
jgi:hypothetical protein